MLEGISQFTLGGIDGRERWVVCFQRHAQSNIYYIAWSALVQTDSSTRLLASERLNTGKCRKIAGFIRAENSNMVHFYGVLCIMTNNDFPMTKIPQHGEN